MRVLKGALCQGADFRSHPKCTSQTWSQSELQQSKKVHLHSNISPHAKAHSIKSVLVHLSSGRCGNVLLQPPKGGGGQS